MIKSFFENSGYVKNNLFKGEDTLNFLSCFFEFTVKIFENQNYDDIEDCLLYLLDIWIYLSKLKKKKII